jgi:maltokinase
MTGGGGPEEHEELARHVGAVPVSELLPPRRAGVAPPEAATDLRDTFPLSGGAVLSVLRAGDEVLVVPLIPEHDAVRRARPGEGVFEDLWTTIRRGGRAGRFTAWSMGSRVPEPLRGERAIDVDQSNESVVVGERVVVKLYPRSVAGPQPGLDLPAHLSAVGFTALPRPLGAMTWTEDDGSDVLLVSAAAFLPGARDGWDWYLERLLAWLDGEADEERAFAPAPVLGALTAAMHAGLATPSEVIADPVRMAGSADIAGWRDAALATLTEALAVTEGEEGRRLGARADAARAAIEALDLVEETSTTRVHGDFHVGQVLEWEGGYAVIDFEGNPAAPASSRSRYDTPVRDVAAFVRSVDHLGRIAHARRPGREADIESWIARSRDVFLDTYWGELAARGHATLFDARLLRPLEVAQELHEYVYAARFLPRWRYVPDLAMRAMFPRGSG